MYDAVILDADSLLFLCCYEEPSFARRKKNLEHRMTEIMRDLHSETLICLVKGKDNFRMAMGVDYKGNRKEDTSEAAIKLKERVAELAQWASADIATPSDGGEADDYCGIVAYDMIEQGHRPIIAHIDKDLNQLIGWHYNFNKGVTYFVEPEDAYHMLMAQCLMGDKTDNIQGLPKYGPVTVTKLLDGIPPEDQWALVKEHWQKFHGRDWQKYLAVCANLVYMRTKKEDLRELSFEELEERFEWKTTDIGSLQQPQGEQSPQEPSDSFTELLD